MQHLHSKIESHQPDIPVWHLNEQLIYSNGSVTIVCRVSVQSVSMDPKVEHMSDMQVKIAETSGATDFTTERYQSVGWNVTG
jgi:hypothetical protein